MTNFKQGDEIRITSKETGASRTIWVVNHPDEEGELVTFNGTDDKAPVVPLKAITDLPDEFEVTLETAFEDALPTVPGEYFDEYTEKLVQLMESMGVDFNNNEYSVFKNPWVLNEDGTWTSPSGDTAPIEDNYLLVVNGIKFVPREERGR